MALFGSSRDARFVRSINKELIRKIIDTRVGVYKLLKKDSGTNIYNETIRKEYYQPVVVPAYIDREDKQIRTDQGTYDYTRNASFAFFRDILKDYNIYIEQGDIIYYDEEYYEIDEIQDTQYFVGKNPETRILDDSFGHSIAYVCLGHVLRKSNLNVTDIRWGEDQSNHDDMTM